MSHVATNPSAGLRIGRLDDRAGWRELTAYGSISAPFVDEPWVSSWIDAFQPREPLLVGAWGGRGDGGDGGDEERLVGLAAMQRLTERWAGRKVTVLQSLTNVECSRFDFLAWRERLDVLERVWQALCSEACDVIRLDHVPEGSPTLLTGLKVAADLGWQSHIYQTFDSPWRALLPPPASWDEGLSRKFKSNLRNREHRIEELGAVTFEVTTGVGGGHDLQRAFEIYYELDSHSWKSQSGTAVFQQANVKTFYERLVDRAPEQIWIPVLSVNGKPAAAQFLLVRDRTIFLQKTAYSLEFAPYTPGQLLTARVVRHGLANGMTALDFLAANMTWKADWAPRIRPHYQLLLFAPSGTGRYAYWSRYGVRQTAKALVRG